MHSAFLSIGSLATRSEDELDHGPTSGTERVCGAHPLAGKGSDLMRLAQVWFAAARASPAAPVAAPQLRHAPAGARGAGRGALTRGDLGAGHALRMVTGGEVAVRRTRSAAARRCGRSPVARGQRVWKRQPDGGRIGFGGSPGRRSRPGAILRGSGIGIAPSSAACRDGSACCRAPRPARPHDLAQVHDRDPIGHVAHDGQVVRDEDVGEPRARPAARRAG